MAGEELGARNAAKIRETLPNVARYEASPTPLATIIVRLLGSRIGVVTVAEWVNEMGFRWLDLTVLLLVL